MMGLPDKSSLSHLLSTAWPHPAKQTSGTPNAAPERTIAQAGQGTGGTWSQHRKNRKIALWHRFGSLKVSTFRILCSTSNNAVHTTPHHYNWLRDALSKQIR